MSAKGSSNEQPRASRETILTVLLVYSIQDDAGDLWTNQRNINGMRKHAAMLENYSNIINLASAPKPSLRTYDPQHLQLSTEGS